MTRFALPTLVLLAALFIALQNGDGDAQFWILPGVEVLPGVQDDLYARGQATWQAILGLGLLAFAAQAWSWSASHRRKRDIRRYLQYAEDHRLWAETWSWARVLSFTEEASPEAGETLGLDG